MPSIVNYGDQQEALDTIDQIHEDNSEKVRKGIPLLSDDLSHWIKTNQMPLHMDKVLRVSLMDARRKEEHQ